MKIIKENEFQETISKGTVLVDFFATWCSPCKMLSPILEQVQNEVENATIVKADVDECENIAREFGIMSVPTMIIFKDGEIQEKLVGLRQKNQIVEAIKKHQ